ncbi:MAG: ankyrin repeat domain-containing protein [Proteobacteria bacterium]|nr:ankyrin repeat domain-containing protein [Pseudomonadota bacterium]NBP14885.1 ankyrin repeat domain-containing protein [bacterium]
MKQCIYLVLLLYSFSNFIESAQDGEPPAELARVDDPREPELVAAVREKDFEKMKNLLDQGVSIFTKTPKGSSLITVAADAGYPKIFYYLMKKGLECDVNHENSEGITPLMLAAQGGHFEIVRALLIKGALVEPKCKLGVDALFLAVDFGNLPVAQLLLAHNASVDTCNKDLNTPLMVASDRSDEAMVELLLQYKARVDLANEVGFTAFIYAAQAGNRKIANLLLKHGADPFVKSKNGLTAFIIACQRGNQQIAQLLFNLNPKIVNFQTNYGATALFYAAHDGHADVVQWLLERGARHIGLNNNNFHTPLYAAAENGHLSVIMKIEDFLNNKQQSILTFFNFEDTLIHAFHRGHNQIVAFLASKAAKAGRFIPQQWQDIIDQQHKIVKVSRKTEPK